MIRRSSYIIANWKMNFTKAEALGYFTAFNAHKLASTAQRAIGFAVPALYLDSLVQAQGGLYMIGTQNVHWKNAGAFTGEIAPPMVTGLGARFTLVGHSERRLLFYESNEMVQEKFTACLTHSLLPVVCVGETLRQRQDGLMFDVLTEQLAFLKAFPQAQFIVAYEPVWAIGTGQTATPEQAQEAHAFIRERLRLIAKELGDKTSIIYGGSVTPENIAALLAQPDIDGGLVGGASLKPDGFAAICGASQAQT